MSEITTSDKPNIVLSTQQEFAVKHIIEYVKKASQDQQYLKNKPAWKQAGYAGTGKTTLLKETIHRLSKDGMLCQPMAFTGKAVIVMREKGVWDAVTIHSYIYTPVGTGDDLEFILKSRAEILSSGVKYFMIDEASMLSLELYQDLLSIGLPMVFVGDPGQLEPVGKDPNLMRSADYTLTEIHRQVADSPILKFATAARAGKSNVFPWGNPSESVSKTTGSSVIIYPKNRDGFYSVELGLIDKVDIVIAATNIERIKINHLVREKKGFKSGPLLVAGERIICQENSRKFGIFNGQMMTVTRVDKHGWDDSKLWIDATDDNGRSYYKLPLLIEGLDWVKTNGVLEYDRRSTAIFDYGYCLTAHKAQGSEWKRVLVLEQWVPMFDMRRWVYTAATRASQELYYGRKL